MNRRNILSTLATGALTLLAPLAAFARRRDPQVLGGNGRWYRVRLVAETNAAPEYRMLREANATSGRSNRYVLAQNVMLRELLAEAGEHIEMWHRVFGTQDECDTEHLIARIDTVLNGEHNA